MDFLLARHGERLDWVDNAWQPKSGGNNKFDTPLSPKGEQQAVCLGKHIAATYPSIHIVLCSPLFRCVQTAAATIKALNSGIKIKIEPGLQEWPMRPVFTVRELATRFPGLIDLDYVPLVPSPKEDETISEVHDRAEMFVKELHKKYGPLVGTPAITSPILLFGHAASVIATVRAFLSDRRFRAHCGVCSLTQIHVEMPSARGISIKNGDSSFLPGGEQYHWTFPGEE